MHNDGMVKTLTLRNVPERVIVALRRRARHNGRSMQRELLSLVERSVDTESLWSRIGAIRKSLRPGGMSLGEIHRALDKGRP